MDPIELIDQGIEQNSLRALSPGEVVDLLLDIRHAITAGGRNYIDIEELLEPV